MRKLISILIFIKCQVSYGQTTRTALQIKKDFNNAIINHQIKRDTATFFSNATQKDTVILTVDSGLIYQSKSHLTIKTSNNKALFNETFSTEYFIRDILEPDSIPNDIIGKAPQNKFIDNYIKTITKSGFETYAHSQIQSFFKDISVSKDDLEEFVDDDGVKDKQLFTQIMKEKEVRAICLPCFNCEDGSRYFIYSAVKRKVVEIIESK